MRRPGRFSRRIPVGIDPVSVAVRPDGREVWVANHVSDTVSVIDADPGSQWFGQVIATIQDVDPDAFSTRFDDPVGIAFASDVKAYVALSSSNRIAIVDVATRKVTGHLPIRAQDPRAMAVQGDRLYVIAFESGNQTQLSGCWSANLRLDTCTFDLQEHVVDNNNVLSRGYDADVVRHPYVPDRDLFVFDTETDRLRQVVSGIGALLYGLAVDESHRVFVAHTDARNHANGRAGTDKDGLQELQNRPWLNRVAWLDCADECGAPTWFDLEPPPPTRPGPGMALATPFGIRLSDDESMLFVTAAGSDRLFMLDVATGAVSGRVRVGATPRGLTLVSGARDRPRELPRLRIAGDKNQPRDKTPPQHEMQPKHEMQQEAAVEREGSGTRFRQNPATVEATRPASVEADEPREIWVYNAADNSVSIVRLGGEQMSLQVSIALADPTHPEIKRGRRVFNDANASSSGSFACASCHPDAHTDHLLWVLDTPRCDLEGCAQTPPRVTMPVRGLRDTEPFHWDGVPGDPYGGINAASVATEAAPTCDADDSAACWRRLVP